MKWKRKQYSRRWLKENQSAVIDSAPTSSFWREQDAHIKTGIVYDKAVMLSTGNTANVSEKGLLPNNKLSAKARELEVLPELKHDSLLSVCKLSDAGYTTVFHCGDGGVYVHCTDNIVSNVKMVAILQGWRDESGLLRVLIEDNVENNNTDTLLIE